jgi:hypothetical protein
MPPLRHAPFNYHLSNQTSILSQLSKVHGRKLPHHYGQSQTYTKQMPTTYTNIAQRNIEIPADLMEKISHVQGTSVSKLTQVKDASRLCEFLAFCEGLGIQNHDVLPAGEDLLIAWASSYAGQLVERTVGAKILVIKKEHKWQGLAWQGGECLHCILKGVEELRLASSYCSKRAPITISMLEDLTRGLSRSSGLNICIHTICLLSFFCQLCSSEILPPTQDLNKFNSQCHATFTHIAESTAQNGTCNLHLPWSKTQKA